MTNDQKLEMKDEKVRYYLEAIQAAETAGNSTEVLERLLCAVRFEHPGWERL